MQDARVIFLRDELERQLYQLTADRPQVPGVTFVRDLGVEHLFALQSLSRQLADPVRTYTSDIWHNPQVATWAKTDSSSLLLVQGNYDSAPRLALFGAQLAEHICQQAPGAYAPSELVSHASDSLPFRLTAAQMMRHIAIQALRRVVCPASLSLLVEITNDFGDAKTCRQWYDVLEKILLRVPSLYIVIHLGTSEVAKEACEWPRAFQSLFGKVRQNSPQTVIRVALISCCSFSDITHDWSTTNALSVGRPELYSGHTLSFASHGLVIPKDLLRLPGEICIKNDDSATPSDVNVTLAASEPEARLDVGSCQIDMTPAHTAAKDDNLRPNDREDFGIAVFCALSRESDAVIALFDRHWDRGDYKKVRGDTNSYTLGAIGSHNVVLVHLPGMGKGVAASVASSCRTSFTGIRLALVVGICGGVPLGRNLESADCSERILGDVVISDGIVQYDLGRQFPNQFVRKSSRHDNQSRPSEEQSRRVLHDATQRHLTALRTCKGFADEMMYEYPGIAADMLYDSSYLHRHRDAAECPAWAETCGTAAITCETARTSNCETLRCDTRQLVERQRLKPAAGQLRDTSLGLMMHIGTVASGDKVMKSGKERDKVAEDENIIAFEMEGAGVWDQFPCLIIKGICDYADCHKSKKWQDYAAATAAACMKAVLEQWD
ncbi:hypothetical protein LCI18_008461 [Fusarium solani-melongenae]|uniref:Uncharacterized protein n=1 Tax=Fusarium solani subsp. cucurbitae TaxID=2747967 RepID=A0ACD3Z8J9_FUSSC|nr:hypothetical protein LCI18_008461 [Fusarium solani-melongenae]